MSAPSTQVLIIGYVWPEPRSSAAGSHMMQIIEQFQQQGWAITFASPAQQGDTRAELKALGIQEASIELNNSSFDLWVKELNPDIVLFDRFMMEEQFGWRVAEQCPQALRVLETSDLHSLRDTRHHLQKQNTDTNTVTEHSPTELFSAMAAHDMTQREIAAIYRCDLTLVLSEFEMSLLTDQFRVAGTLLCYCPFMLNAPNIIDWPSYSTRKDFVTIGNFLHAPNWDSVLWLKQSIWPLIHKQLPDAQLFIYGAYTPQKALDLHNPKQGFHVLGWAEDATQVIKQARVCLAPLRFGAGIKGKLADAILCGTPSITTHIGAEGMGLTEYAHTSAETIANAAVELYANETKWQQAQQTGLAILNQRFNKQQIGAQLIQQIQSCRKQLHQHRLQNFTGLMLQHHAHKSTQYMARWIEAKNKISG